MPDPKSTLTAINQASSVFTTLVAVINAYRKQASKDEQLKGALEDFFLRTSRIKDWVEAINQAPPPVEVYNFHIVHQLASVAEEAQKALTEVARGKADPKDTAVTVHEGCADMTPRQGSEPTATPKDPNAGVAGEAPIGSLTLYSKFTVYIYIVIETHYVFWTSIFCRYTSGAVLVPDRSNWSCIIYVKSCHEYHPCIYVIWLARLALLAPNAMTSVQQLLNRKAKSVGF